MRRVITIHGINSAGEWQDIVRPVFKAHFDYQAIRYEDYLRFGATKLVFLLLRRTKVLKKVKMAFSDRVGPGERPHVIAHSLGTYLMAHLAKKHADVRLGRVVLTGCVLPAKFDWGAILTDNPSAFEAIRNEVGKKDKVAWLAYHFKRLVPGLGHAGLVGFVGPATEVHTVHGSNRYCDNCPKGSATVRIHNVLHPERGHSDQFLGKNDAVHFWLPFFWRIEPPEYQEFLEYCSEAAERDQEKDVVGRHVAETALRVHHWYWAGGTLGAFVAKQIEFRLEVKGKTLREEDLDKRVKRAISLIWRAVDKAVREADPQNTSPNSWDLQNLNPKIAACRAAEAIGSTPG